MSDGFINIAIKEKFNGTTASRKHLSNKGKHILRQHSEETLKTMKQKSFDPEKSKNNETLISQQKPGETLNQTVDRIIKEQEIEKPARNTAIRAVAGIISIPSECMSDPSKLKLFQDKAKEFLETNDKLKGNVILAQTNFDETQPHIEFVFIPRDNENPKKLDYSKLFGTDLRKGYDGSKSLEKLHDEVALKVGKPLGLKRGDGTNTKGLTNAEYMKSISDMKNDEKTLSQIEVKEPPKPMQHNALNPYKNIETLKEENKQLRDYIKQTREDRNRLRTTKGILAQNRQVRFDKRDLKTKNKELEENNKLYQNALGNKKPRPELVKDFKEFVEERDKKKLEKEREEQEKEQRKLDRQREREFIESIERRKAFNEEMQQPGQSKKMAFRPKFTPPIDEKK